MVKDGSTLEEAGRVYGIGRERVRQILKQEGIRASDLPGRAEFGLGKRAQSRSGEHPAPVREAPPGVEPTLSEFPPRLAPVIEAMWREGMLYHEIANVFDTSCEVVHRVICERMPQAERSAQTTALLKDRRPLEERHLDGMRRAASVLAEVHTIHGDERRHAQAVIGDWLAAHPQRPEAADPASSPERVGPADLLDELDHFKADLRAGGLRESTVHSYLMGSSLFVRWLAGEYAPSPRRSVRPHGRRGRRPDRPRPAPGPAE